MYDPVHVSQQPSPSSLVPLSLFPFRRVLSSSPPRLSASPSAVISTVGPTAPGACPTSFFQGSLPSSIAQFLSCLCFSSLRLPPPQRRASPVFSCFRTSTEPFMRLPSPICSPLGAARNQCAPPRLLFFSLAFSLTLVEFDSFCFPFLPLTPGPSNPSPKASLSLTPVVSVSESAHFPDRLSPGVQSRRLEVQFNPVARASRSTCGMRVVPSSQRASWSVFPTSFALASEIASRASLRHLSSISRRSAKPFFLP